MKRRATKRTAKPRAAKAPGKTRGLARELAEARNQQAVVSEILQVISTSRADAQPVFDVIVKSGAHLFAGMNVSLRLVKGDHTYTVASTIALGETGGALPVPIDEGVPSSRAMLRRQVVEIRDTHAPEEWVSPLALDHAARRGYRALLIAPMLREERALGSIMVTRPTPGPFSEEHVALLKTFAAQAVIAIENVRLFKELQSRNAELTESLEQQTATAEILRVISSSPTDSQPVFDAIARNTALVCGADNGVMRLVDGDVLRPVANYGDLPALPDIPIDTATVVGRCIREARTVHVPDVTEASAQAEFPDGRGAAAGYRTILAVPLLLDGVAIGMIGSRRLEKRPFTERQIKLLETFAAQAVIAIENARLFNELQTRNAELTESLEQQTATAEILRVISSSPTDIQPVFDKILQSCERLFSGTLVGINVTGEDGLLQIGAYRGPGREGFERIFPLRPDRSSGSGLSLVERRVIHYPDAGSADVPPATRTGCAAIGIKSVIFAPMLWEDHGLGAIFVGRDYSAPFSEKEIALLKTFSDQAAIAVQNTRLFNEIRDKSRELEAANNQLDIANRHKSEFLAGMSHELRTPLNAIIGFSEVLQEQMFGEINEKQREYLGDIHSSSVHLLSLINDILDLSKIEAGRMDLELSRFDLRTALDNALTLIRERATKNNIGLKLECEEEIGEWTADERKFKQIALNLLSNAVKFTPSGGTISVCARRANGCVEIAVSDTGVGIKPEDQPLVFEEFRQVGGDRLRKSEGTGLGLALTKRFVELHGGTITLHSEMNKGSTFIFTLPEVYARTPGDKTA